MDWIDDPHKREEHNYDSAGVGTNRYATILLYMSNITHGGETVFKKAWPNDIPESEYKSREEALTELRKDGTVDMFKRGSWEESMVADCRSRLAVKPHSARAVLFYSQHPNGEEDTESLHGGCPVLDGEKWAANLWVSMCAKDGLVYLYSIEQAYAHCSDSVPLTIHLLPKKVWNGIRGGYPGEQIINYNLFCHISSTKDLILVNTSC